MATLTAVLLPTLLAFACGIFATLSLIEKPVWPLMTHPGNPRVDDETARIVHAELKRVIRLLPPTMITTMSAVLLLLVVQTWLSGFSVRPSLVLGTFVVTMAMVVYLLKARIDAVAQTPSDGVITAVRKGLGELALLHHLGLFAASSTLLVQYLLIIV